jgi:hypothetical protein
MSPYDEWCKRNGCFHAHCPKGCEHPQPAVTQTGDLICGLHMAFRHEYVLMEPCDPKICTEGQL